MKCSYIWTNDLKSGDNPLGGKLSNMKLGWVLSGCISGIWIRERIHHPNPLTPGHKPWECVGYTKFKLRKEGFRESEKKIKNLCSLVNTLTPCIKRMLACSVMSGSLWPYRLQPARLLCRWNFPGKNTGVSCHFLLHSIFLTKGSNPCRSHLLQGQAGSLPNEPPGKPLK